MRAQFVRAVCLDIGRLEKIECIAFGMGILLDYLMFHAVLKFFFRMACKQVLAVTLV